MLVGGGIGIAPLALLRRELARRGIAQRVLLGFRDRAHSGGLDLFDCSEVRTASEDGHTGHQGYVTDLLAVLLEGDDAGAGAVYACGPPAMLEAVRVLCAARAVPAELAMETPMACGFGSCFGCAVPVAAGGYIRLCVDGPTVNAARDRVGPGRGERALNMAPQQRRGSATPRMDLSLELCGIRLAHPILNGSGTFDAIAARRAFGEALDSRFPFSIFVSKTITPEPRAGNPPPRLYETPSGLINSIGLPNKGLDGFLDQDLPELARLPAPLCVSVMAPSREGFAALVEGVGAATRSPRSSSTSPARTSSPG